MSKLNHPLYLGNHLRCVTGHLETDVYLILSIMEPDVKNGKHIYVQWPVFRNKKVKSQSPVQIYPNLDATQ